MTNTGSCTITQPTPTKLVTFYKHDKAVGCFDFVDGAMHFDGDLTESGKAFVEWVLSAVNKHIDDAVKAEREACAKVCYELPWADLKITPSNLAYAAAIRERGNK